MTLPTWSINSLERDLSSGTVTVIHWNVSIAEGDYRASAYGSVSLDAPDPDVFIPYKNLSIEVVLSWLHDALGKEQVNAYDKSLANQIKEQKTPSKVTGLPW